MDIEAIKILSAALALLPILGIGLALGKIFSSFNDAVSRNPSVQNSLFGTLIFGFAVTEALAIFCLGISLLILFGL